MQLHAAVLERAACSSPAAFCSASRPAWSWAAIVATSPSLRRAQLHVDLAERLGPELQRGARVAGAGRRDADELLDALGGLDDRAAW